MPTISVSEATLKARLEALIAVWASVSEKFPLVGTLPPETRALSARYCAELWATDPSSASLTLRLLREARKIELVFQGTRGPRGKPAVYRLLPDTTEEFGPEPPRVLGMNVCANCHRLKTLVCEHDFKNKCGPYLDE